jgi:hypothetical protein
MVSERFDSAPSYSSKPYFMFKCIAPPNQKCQDFRKYLLDYMAEIDSVQLHQTYKESYDILDQYSDFELLQYWITYNGVFDGGESMLNELKRLAF